MLARCDRNAGRKHSAILRAPDAVEEEDSLHYQIIDLCRAKGWSYIHPRMDRKSTIGEGAPDFVLLIDGGKTLFLECKDREGKVSVKQQAWHAQAKRNGHTVHVARSIQEVIDLIYQLKFPIPHPA